MEEDGAVPVSARGRVQRAIRLEEVDRHPRGELLIGPRFLEKLLGSSEYESAAALLEGASILGLDLLVVDAGEDSAADLVSTLARDSDLFIFALVNGPFGAAGAALGEIEAMLQIHRGGADVQALMRSSAERGVTAARRCLEAGAGGIVVADDLAHGRSTYLSPEMLREWVFPHLTEMVGALAAGGTPVFLHSDGYYADIVPDLARLGLAGLQCLDPNCGMDFRALREGPAADLCLWGDLDGDLVMGEHPPEEVERRVAEALSAGPPRRGYIFGTCCGIADMARVEQVQAVYRAAPAVSGRK